MKETAHEENTHCLKEGPLPDSIIYLKKANDDLVSHCSCDDGRISFPAQMDCPWCGCGWLFSCLTCRKAFTFARAVELQTSWESLAAEDYRGMYGENPSAADIEPWVETMKCLLSHLEVGETYAILDACVNHVDCEDIRYDGWYASHDFKRMPQVEALKQPEIIDEGIGNPGYWRDRALKDLDA